MLSYPSRTLGRALTLLLALATGLAAAALAYALLRRPALRTEARVPASVRIVVAARDIPARSEVTVNMLRFQSLPASQVPAGALKTFTPLIGKVTLASVSANIPVTPAMVAAPSMELGLAYALHPSYRAVTVALDPISGIDGLLKPGDRVDVLTTCDLGDGQSVTRTVLQDVSLLATGGTPPAPNATVAVSPGDAQRLVMAATRGKVQLTLRSPDDNAQPDIPALHSSVVTGIAPKPTPTLPLATKPTASSAKVALPASKAPVAPPPSPPPAQIIVIRGTEAKTITVGG